MRSKCKPYIRGKISKKQETQDDVTAAFNKVMRIFVPKGGF